MRKIKIKIREGEGGNIRKGKERVKAIMREEEAEGER